jgi:hypothetical protein
MMILQCGGKCGHTARIAFPHRNSIAQGAQSLRRTDQCGHLVAVPERLFDEGAAVAARRAQNQYSLNIHAL